MKKILISLITAILFTSCNNWLDVKPNDRISEDATFSTPRGFELALNGVYVDLNKTALYGRQLTWDFVEILAQRYAIGKSTTYNKAAIDFDYGSEEVKTRVRSIWAQGYSLIANINLILKNCEERREVLSDEYYHLVKGEALALRAFMHFDLFRLWGPIYSTASQTNTYIPYYSHFALNSEPKLTAKDFMDNVIADLVVADSLLKDYDPIETQGSLKPNAAYNFKSYRVLRMNYYAVKLLLARAYLYVDDKANALNAAKEVINVQNRLFPWVNPTSLSANQDTPDRMFSTELLFALQNVTRSTIYTSSFNTGSLKLASLLAPEMDVVDDCLFDGEHGDLRFKTWLDKNAEVEGGAYKELMKYQTLSTDSLYMQLIPMLRVSEAYYIAAECEYDTDEDVAMDYLNQVRNARLLGDEMSYFYDNVLENEYSREFWGEGQLFFFYKRKNYSQIPSAYEPYEYVNMDATRYVLIIPEDESKYN